MNWLITGGIVIIFLFAIGYIKTPVDTAAIFFCYVFLYASENICNEIKKLRK
jgi:hypothetical protein